MLTLWNYPMRFRRNYDRPAMPHMELSDGADALGVRVDLYPRSAREARAEHERVEGVAVRADRVDHAPVVERRGERRDEVDVAGRGPLHEGPRRDLDDHLTRDHAFASEGRSLTGAAIARRHARESSTSWR